MGLDSHQNMSEVIDHVVWPMAEMEAEVVVMAEGAVVTPLSAALEQENQ